MFLMLLPNIVHYIDITKYWFYSLQQRRLYCSTKACKTTRNITQNETIVYKIIRESWPVFSYFLWIPPVSYTHNTRKWTKHNNCTGVFGYEPSLLLIHRTCPVNDGASNPLQILLFLTHTDSNDIYISTQVIYWANTFPSSCLGI